jgi:5'-nucleotidase/UDP-sugar diphosphatase
MSEIRIIHTSDLHGALTRAKAARLRELKAEHEALLFDTGDAIRAPNVACLPWRERAIHRMNEAGYDAMGLGNREYFFRVGGMRWKTGHATFLRICTNLGASSDKIRPAHDPWKELRTAGGARVGLLSFMPTMIEPGHWFEWLSNTRFREWQQVARTAASALAGECDVVVALFHRPEEEMDELATLCPGIDLILLGHSHGTPGALERRADGLLVSRVGERARHARLIGLRAEDRSVTMDELIALDAPEFPEKA